MTVFAAAAAALCASARADEAAFVNVAGQRPVVLAAAPEGAGDPAIEKLLTRPADLWERLRQGFAMPDLDRRLVAVHEAWYAARPELLRGILGRARRYLHYIVEEVERRGLPAELALLPAVESGFNPMALSPAQASGLWQFIPDTGTRYKLAQTAHFDARRDVLASTGAALDYLQSLYALHHDWHLALASYNWGEQSVLRAVERRRERGGGFERLALPEETRNYVPRLMALRNIVLEPEKFGLDLGDLPDEPYFTSVALDLDLDLRLASRLADVPYEDLLALNPGYNRPLAAGAVRAALVVPAERAEFLRLSLERYREERARERPPATRRKR
jgi:membrane-bound lytic murein transglycosylase D